MRKDYAPQQEDESVGISRESLDYYELRVRRWRNRVMLGLLFILLGFWTHLLFFSGIFAIQKIIIATPLQQITEEEVQKRAKFFLAQKWWRLIPKNSVVLFQPEELEEFFSRDARIRDITVTKNMFERSLTIALQERVPFFILLLKDKAFALDQEGRALTELTLPAPKTLPHITDVRERDVTLGEVAFPQELFTFLKTFRNELPQIIHFTTLAIGKPSDDAITFTTGEEWEIYTSTKDSASEQLQRLRALLATKINPEKRKKLQYIDLRFGEKVYYK